MNVSRILALETTDTAGGVALCEGDKIVASRALDPERRSAQTLAPAIRDVLCGVGWKPSDVAIVAVAVGPGSFTGLRVGLTTAKVFAWSVGARLVAVDSLDAIAEEQREFCVEVEGDGALFSVGMDAQRGDVVFRNYWIPRRKSEISAASETSGAPVPLTTQFRLASIKKWLDVKNDWAEHFLNDADLSSAGLSSAGLERDEFKNVWARSQVCARNLDVIFTGSVLERVKDLSGAYPDLRFGASDVRRPSAEGVARVAVRRARLGLFDDLWNATPKYSRKAAAEERRDGK